MNLSNSSTTYTDCESVEKMRGFLRLLSFRASFNENSLEKITIFPKTPLKKLHPTKLPATQHRCAAGIHVVGL